MSTNGDESIERLRDEMVSVFRSSRDLATVVQIDTGSIGQRYARRVRIMLNDGVVFDGDPEKDEAPGPIVWEDVVVSEETAMVVIDYFEGSGGRAGYFERQLICAILHADDVHSEALGASMVIREWVRAVHLWKSAKHVLHEIVGR